MQRLTVSDETWTALLRLKHSDGGDAAGRSADDPAWQVYAPIARPQAPFVIAQVGQSVDGRVATLSGDASDISGPDGILHLHRLRALVDAVIVGVGTVVADDPRLTVREVEGPCPVRVIIDPSGRLPRDASLLNDEGPETLVVRDRLRCCETTGNLIHLAATDGRLSPRCILDALAARGLYSVLVEGGSNTIGAFLDGGHVDRLHVAVSPLVIGSGPAGINLQTVTRLDQARRPPCRAYDLGSDVLFDLDFGKAG
jgi:diaminohydroxyphosphoribosylaminopyrimidine deaminase/5-amino-6-(5-phosphoribosylamino)uracil reductase